jgi:hypothetical protein
MDSEKSPEQLGQTQEAKPKIEATVTEFFESKPDNVFFKITDMTLRGASTVGSSGLITPKTERFAVPAIRLWCSSDECDGVRTFDPDHNDSTLHLSETDDEARNRFINFLCRNCRRSRKIFAVRYKYDEDGKTVLALKLGEHPPLSRQIPGRLRKLVGTDQEKFNKGLRSEAYGLGVGAFGYYRQVIENQKDRLIDEILKVANLENPTPELIKELEEAKRESQFSTAVEKIKHRIPEILLIHGYNPLTLLHKALSEGLHVASDEECLEIAHNIRVILSEFSERLATALKDDQELKNAVSAIANRSQKSK